MRHHTVSGTVVVGVVSLSLLLSYGPSLIGQQPGRPRPELSDAEHREKVRELERLREQIDRLIKEVEGEAKPSPTRPPVIRPTPEKPLEPEKSAGSSDRIAALKLDRVGSSGGGFGYNMSIGWEFETTASVQITELGIWDSDGKGLDVDTPVGLWDASGRLLTSALLPRGVEAQLVDGFRYTTIKPVELEPNRHYVIAALYTPRTKDNVISHGGANFSAAAPIRWSRSRRAKSEELALPETTSSHAPSDDSLPGSFGPNFLMASSEAAQGVRSYYRTRQVQQMPKMQTVIVPEQADGSHREEKIMTVSLYALPNGQLTQIMFNETPLGTGDTAFASLANELQRLKLVNTNDRPIIRVAAMPSVKLTDMHMTMGVTEYGHYSPRDTRRIVRGGEVGTLAAARMLQPERGGDFVVADRFKDVGDYVEDRWTGLLWQKDGSASGKKNYYEARDYAANLELGGIRGWRVPKIEEYATIFPANFAPFTNSHYTSNQCCQGPTEYHSYWTSELDLPTKDYAYVFHWYAKGGANNCYASKNYDFVRCVHDPLERPERE